MVATVRSKPYIQLTESLLFLAGRCNGASSRDDVGFNGADTDFGRSLALQVEKGVRLTASQQFKALEMMGKYLETQLKRNGYELPSQDELDRPILKSSTITAEPEPIAPSTPTEFEGLNEQQLEAAMAIVDWALNGDEQFYLLSGFAGTGKSFTVQVITKHLQSKGVTVCYSAPTHKATEVLRVMAGRSGLSVDCETIQSLLWLTVDYDDSGKEILVENHKKSSGNHILHYQFVVVDESSMISEELWKFLYDIVSVHLPCKVLLMGDPAQLPPVNEQESPAFKVYPRSELTKVMRFDGSILKLATEHRDSINSRTPIVPATSIDEDAKGVYVVDESTWLAQICRAFGSENAKANPDHTRILAWTNKRVDHLNNYVRSFLHGSDAPTFLQGERLMARTSIPAKKTVTSQRWDHDRQEKVCTEKEVSYTALPTCGQCVVASIVHGRETMDGQSFAVFYMTIVDEVGSVHDLTVLGDEDWEKFDKHMLEWRKEAKQTKQWRPYYEALEHFCVFYKGSNLMRRLSYGYALTVHSSQGSTFRNVFVDLSDIRRNRKHRERNQCSYVAVSRAAERVLICQ